MSNLIVSERETQNRIVKLFQETLGYREIKPVKGTKNPNILENVLYEWLVRQGYSSSLADGAVKQLCNDASIKDNLYQANSAFYTRLKYGAKVKEKAGSSEKTVYCIDFEHPEKNDFYIAQEVRIGKAETRRPDLVIYVNGIALAVIELKRSDISVLEGIRQNINNQCDKSVQGFFTTIQFCMAGNNSEGLRYGTLLTPQEHYYEWKNDGYKAFLDERDKNDVQIETKSETIPNKLDRQIYSMFQKTRFLDLIHNFIAFDGGIKKVCRYNQYFAIKRAQSRIANKKEGGIIWHTQGSGKSLTMVWLSKWILGEYANKANARVLIITDREELDEQIEKLYKAVGETTVIRSQSGANLLKLLKPDGGKIICSLIHKFKIANNNSKESNNHENAEQEFIESFQNANSNEISPNDVFFVFVDECHRTQSNKLHDAMKQVLPNAIFIGFTGTPLLRRDKRTSVETFGGYIHTYKFNEGVRDGAILDLRYEARDVPLDITSPEEIDEWFEMKTKGLSDVAKAKLKQRWGNLQKIFSSRSRLERIANDIIVDFGVKPRLIDGSGNAILVAASILEACKFYDIFQERGFHECAIISSYIPQFSDLSNGDGNHADNESAQKYNTYLRMLNQNLRALENFEKETRQKFVDEPAQMKLLIVVDKLLTGFDAPNCTYLYIDKPMRDHGLFQAICRVNRLGGKSKDFGYIIDYKQLFGQLANAMNTYTAGAFEGYDTEDVEGLLKDRTAEAKKYFEKTREELDELCEGVAYPQNELNYQHYFCGDNSKRLQDSYQNEICARNRATLYRLVGRLLRAYAELKPRMNEAGYTVDEQKKLENLVTNYLHLREMIGIASGDFVDSPKYDPEMRYLIDHYIVAYETHHIGNLENVTLCDFVEFYQKNLVEGEQEKRDSVAETIENNIRKKIIEKLHQNPQYFERMSGILERLILERRNGSLSYQQLLERYMELARNVAQPETNSVYPKSINNGALRALYDNCGNDIHLALKIHEAVMEVRQDGFRCNAIKEKKVMHAIANIVGEGDGTERIYAIVKEQEEY